jgi:glycine/D-amino acid oxidase-like deaminating enzyme
MEEFDLTIIGAGIIGSMAAYFASAQMPVWRTALLDRSVVGSGATLYSVGLDFPYGRSAAQREIASESIRLFAELRAEIPDLPIYELPFFGVVSKENLDGVLAGFALNGVRRADEADREHLLRSYPELKLSENQVLLTGCRASYGLPQRIAQILVDKFRESPGNVCWEGVEVQSLQAVEGGFSLHTGDGRTISSRRVLVATGPWMPRGPGGDAARDAGVRIKKVAAMHVDRPPQLDDPILFFFDEDSFLLPVHTARRWLFSFTSQEWDCAPEVSRLRISVEDRALALSILRRYYPSFAEHCNGGRVFCDAYTPERVPLVAASAEAPNLVLAGACAGSGYRLAPGIAVSALKQFL